MVVIELASVQGQKIKLGPSFQTEFSAVVSKGGIFFPLHKAFVRTHLEY